MSAIPSSAQTPSRPLALIMRLVFYCASTNRKTYGVNLDAPHHIHPGVISTKASEAVATFRQPKGPGPNDISSADITSQLGVHPINTNPQQKQEHGGYCTALIRLHHLREKTTGRQDKEISALRRVKWTHSGFGSHLYTPGQSVLTNAHRLQHTEHPGIWRIM